MSSMWFCKFIYLFVVFFFTFFFVKASSCTFKTIATTIAICVMTFGRPMVPMEKISSHVAKLTFFSYEKPS